MQVAYDLILTNGIVFDDTNGLRGVRRDIAIAEGRIAVVSEHIEPSLARETHDLTGYNISPGWIDIHVHAYGGLGLRNKQMVGILQGATTVVDAGDFGTSTFNDFKAMTSDSIADVKGFVHIDPVGIPYTALNRADYSNRATADLISLIERNRDTIKGIKLGALGEMPFHNIEIVKSVATQARVSYFMHLGEVKFFPARESLTRRAIAILTEGDIATHIYTNDMGRIINDDGRLVPEIVEANKRGVVFDIGHGVGNFSFSIAERAIDQGILPRTISSDLNGLCVGSSSDLPATMTRMFALGFSVDDIIRMVTSAPAAVLGLIDVGTFRSGARADITVFRCDEGAFEVFDADKAARVTKRRIIAECVYKNGVRHACDVDSIHKPENFFMKVRDPASANSLAMSNEERWFLGTLFETLGAIEEWDGPLIHAAIDDVLSGSDLGRRQALDALYHVFIADESAGFCPQIGSILTRMGNEDLRAYRAAIGV